MKRKLASIQIISELHPIDNADRILRAVILGWNVIVKKGEFKVGDRCIFFEIDAVLPDVDWAEFMRPRNFRVKTCKLRGELSQGLALPLSILPDNHKVEDIKHCPTCSDELSVTWKEINPREFDVGTDVTEILKVRKYEPTARGGFKSGNSAGSFPSRIPKTDELRLQSVIDVLDEIKGVPIYWTVKCDGTSGTFANIDGEFCVCSRNWKKKEGENVYWGMAKKYKLESKIPENFAIQGEICGPGIQKNHLRLKEIELFIFDVFNIKMGRYLGLEDFLEFCKQLDLTTVPIERIIYNPEGLDLSLSTWLERAKGLYNGTTSRREGIVVRTITSQYSKIIKGRLSFKVINNDFLLKDED